VNPWSSQQTPFHEIDTLNPINIGDASPPFIEIRRTKVESFLHWYYQYSSLTTSVKKKIESCFDFLRNLFEKCNKTR
jgi:hypothetical protein